MTPVATPAAPAAPVTVGPAAGNTMNVYERVKDPLAFAKQMAPAAASVMKAPIDQGEAIALHALCEGITLIEMRRRYHWIKGAPSMRADAMLAEFRLNHGGQYKMVERSERRAAIELTDRYGVTWPVFEFTIEQLMASRWPWTDWRKPEGERELKDNYATPTDQKAMLWARLVSESLRVVCPELVAGVYTPEEMGDVIETEFVEAPRPTADELLKRARADSAEVVSSEASIGATPESPVEPAVAPDQPGSITEATKEAIEAAFVTLGATQETIERVLSKRQAKVVRNLSQQDGQTLLDQLREMQRAKDDAGN